MGEKEKRMSRVERVGKAGGEGGQDIWNGSRPFVVIY